MSGDHFSLKYKNRESLFYRYHQGGGHFFKKGESVFYRKEVTFSKEKCLGVVGSLYFVTPAGVRFWSFLQSRCQLLAVLI